MPFRIVLHGRLTLSPKCQEWAGHCWPALVCRYVYFYILLIGYCPSKMSVSVKPRFFLLQTTGSLYAAALQHCSTALQSPGLQTGTFTVFSWVWPWLAHCRSLQGWLGSTSAVSAAADSAVSCHQIQINSSRTQAKHPRKMVCFRKQN